jgi:putative tryptophan/tyrosine transport system substrate-binding protein
MNRREVIVGLGAAAWPLVARAQQRSTPAIGYLSVQTEAADRTLLAAYRRGLSEQGYVEGRNIEILYRYSDARADRLQALAEDLVRNRVSVIYANGGPPHVKAAKAASATTPIVFVTGVDPVSAGLVASLSRPGSNITGATFLSQELTPKRLELLHEVVPAVTTIGFMAPKGDPLILETERAARSLGVRVAVANASTPDEIEAAFAGLVGQRIGAFVGGRQGVFFVTAPQLAALAARYKLPAIYAFREAVEAGGLMSYGANIADAVRIAGGYTGRVLKGEKPADLPVQQSTKIEMVINLRTAKTLGVDVPPKVLALADEVIE